MGQKPVMMPLQPLIDCVLNTIFFSQRACFKLTEYSNPKNKAACLRLEPSESNKTTCSYTIQHMVQSKGAKLGRNVPFPNQRQIQF